MHDHAIYSSFDFDACYLSFLHGLYLFRYINSISPNDTDLYYKFSTNSVDVVLFMIMEMKIIFAIE